MLVYRELSNKVLGALFTVHNIAGPGLAESAYEGALAIEFSRLGIPFSRQKAFDFYYKGEIAGFYVADMVVEDKIILELKSVQALNPVMEAQLINYLKISGLTAGYLVNFRNTKLEWKRMIC